MYELGTKITLSESTVFSQRSSTVGEIIFALEICSKHTMYFLRIEIEVSAVSRDRVVPDNQGDTVAEGFVNETSKKKMLKIHFNCHFVIKQQCELQSKKSILTVHFVKATK